jgi:hypothetical protein
MRMRAVAPTPTGMRGDRVPSQYLLKLYETEAVQFNG